jgi:hypothetical protein
MSNIPRFAQYAAAFEKAYASNDFSLVEPFFTEDAVYEVKDIPPPLGGEQKGRDAILAYFPRVLDAFDRRFATREVKLLEGPREDGDSVWIRGAAIYTAAGVPDLCFELEEQAWFDGDRIRRLEDRYERRQAEALRAYAREHGAKLGIRWE